MAICKYCKSEKPNDEYLMCEGCRIRTRENEKNRRERIKRGETIKRYNKKPKPKPKEKPNARLDEKIKRLNEYNDLHGTRLTYGKYMGLVRMGKIY